EGHVCKNVGLVKLETAPLRSHKLCGYCRSACACCQRSEPLMMKTGRRLVKKSSSKAAENEDPAGFHPLHFEEQRVPGTLRGSSERERSWGTFSTACQAGRGSASYE